MGRRMDWEEASRREKVGRFAPERKPQAPWIWASPLSQVGQGRSHICVFCGGSVTGANRAAYKRHGKRRDGQRGKPVACSKCAVSERLSVGMP